MIFQSSKWDRNMYLINITVGHVFPLLGNSVIWYIVPQIIHYMHLCLSVQTAPGTGWIPSAEDRQ